MERKLFHGDMGAIDIARALLAEFDRGNLRARIVGQGDELAVQIATRPGSRSGGSTALTVWIKKAEDGVWVQPGGQEWLGTAASLGHTTLATLANPWNLLHRLDDIAQDVENIQLVERVWTAINRTASLLGADTELSSRLRSVVCEYCATANRVGEPSCIACGAPLGPAQPTTCPQCGFVASPDDVRCRNCGKELKVSASQRRSST